MTLFDTKVQYSQFFETLWQAYPLKISKHEGYKAFKRLKIERSEDVTRLIDSIRAHQKTAKWQRGIIPHLSTYLNQRRWEDELEPQKTETLRSQIDPIVEEAFRERWEQESKKEPH